MDCKSTRLNYRDTGAFSKIAVDYANGADQLASFFAWNPDIDGIKRAITAREAFATERPLLVSALRDQYSLVETGDKVNSNIESLLDEKTFVVTTAHQNNLFTGPLYFLYKIIHAIKLCAKLQQQLPDYRFVPVYYMGSEDADFDELNHIHINGERLAWNSGQSGAVGRMIINNELLVLIDIIEGQIGILPHGAEAVELLRDSYRKGESMQVATFRIVHRLFQDHGLVVLIPDNAKLKSRAVDLFKDELLHQHASGIVEGSSARLAELYKVQAYPREINLFYLDDEIRDRIEKDGEEWKLVSGRKTFSREGLLSELENHPERFSPNVILRGMFQEMILPGVAFIGGGGELAYWLQLKDLFAFYKVPYPVQVLRNSFLLLEKKWSHLAEKLGLELPQLFLSKDKLLQLIVSRDSDHELKLNGTLDAAAKLYDDIHSQAIAVDASLGQHVNALRVKAVHRMQELEKKMLRAEKRRFSDQNRQLEQLKAVLFPKNNLQERVESFLPFYAKWGREFISIIEKCSPSLEQEFVIINLPPGDGH